jgi:hypothetical protein
MVNVRRERTWVGPYRRENGTEVEGHESHALTGSPRWGVFYRNKEVVLPGGSRHAQRRDLSERWRLRDYYPSNEAAERARRALMREGKHAVIVNVGAREGYPNQGDLEAMLRRSDLDKHRRR